MHFDGLSAGTTSRLITSRYFPRTTTQGFCMRFFYHLYGSNIGTFEVVAIDENTMQELVVSCTFDIYICIKLVMLLVIQA